MGCHLPGHLLCAAGRIQHPSLCYRSALGIQGQSNSNKLAELLLPLFLFSGIYISILAVNNVRYILFYATEFHFSIFIAPEQINDIDKIGMVAGQFNNG